MNYAALAQRVALFRGISVENIEKIIKKGHTQRVSQGDALFYKGTTGNSMYVVLSGSVGVYDGEDLLAKLGVGEMVGEMSLLDGEPRSATVKALEDSVVYRLDEDLFKRLLTKKVAIDMLLNIGGVIAKRLQGANQRIRELQGR